MISALEIGFALSLTALVLACVSHQPRPKPVRVRRRVVQSQRGPQA